MKITFINNDGSGFADDVEIDEGTTIMAFFQKKMGELAQPAGYMIRINRQTVQGDTILVEGDRVSITPSKIDGACMCGQGGDPEDMDFTDPTETPAGSQDAADNAVTVTDPDAPVEASQSKGQAETDSQETVVEGMADAASDGDVVGSETPSGAPEPGEDPIG